MKRRRIKDRKMFLLLLVLGLTLGFATVATTLKIKGFTLIKKNTWDIRWDRNSIVLSEDMPSGTAAPTPSTKTTTDDTISFNANLKLPGDYYEFYVDALNNGTINGEIASITTSWKQNGQAISLPSFLKYTIIYADTETAPVQGDVLYAGSSRTYKIRLEYRDDATEVLNSDTTYVGTIAITYNQGPDEAAPSGRGGPGARKIANKVDDPSVIPEDPAVIPNPVSSPKPAIQNEGEPTIPAGEDIIYTSHGPNNYIYFNCDSLDNQNADNCEIWRIIGTDKDVGDRIKIIREESIGQFAWNTNTGLVTNNWETATLKTYLNTTYYNSLTEVSKKLIPEVTWYTAGADSNMYYFTSGAAYNWERKKITTSNTSYKRNNVKAKVGLMYASDYGYASSVCSSSCLATDALPMEYPCRYDALDPSTGKYDVSDFYPMYDYNEDECRESNWLYARLDEWTLTSWFGSTGFDCFAGGPYCHNDPYNFDATYYINNGNPKVDKAGTLFMDVVYELKDVRPVVYLKSGVDLEGIGTLKDPYRIIASSDVLNNDDILPSDGGGSEDPSGGADITHTTDNPSCGDTTPPTCELNHVNVLSNGFDFAFNCTDDIEINRITSLFDSDPFSGDYDSRTFDRIGTIKKGTVINGGKTKTYSGRWTTSAAKNPPNKRTCYHFSYGGEDKCGNWVVYHTPNCFQFGQ